MLNEQRTKLNQMSQQVAQAYKNRSNAANAQLINNLNTQMRNGIIQRGRSTKCMVSNLPYGSSAQIANNAGAYCNSP
jgi:23S rRNA G2445 N2-methylase RlmL